jgi:3-methyladenine DNA glycosylase/8-oxoguanine DNA glycosylase
VTAAASPAASAAGVVVEREVRPRWPLRLPVRGGMDGCLRVRDGEVRRLLHVEGAPVWLSARQPALGRVVLRARAERRDLAEEGVARLRFALGVDDDLRPFHDRFRWDPLIGRSVRARPLLRVPRRPEPFEALAWAVTEQLIELARAVEIQRRIVRRLGRRCPCCGLRDLPSPARLAAAAPAELAALGLHPARALTLRRAAREVARRRVDLHDPDHERAWRRLRAIPGVGTWTVECLALHGQGRLDQVPAGDLGYLKLAGRILTGDPRARAEEDEVRALLAPYHPWAGLAGEHLRTWLPRPSLGPPRRRRPPAAPAAARR